jgi:hypothetical protein
VQQFPFLLSTIQKDHLRLSLDSLNTFHRNFLTIHDIEFPVRMHYSDSKAPILLSFVIPLALAIVSSKIID